MRRLSRAHRVTITAPGRRRPGARPPSAEASPSPKCSNQGVETKCVFLLAAILFYTPARRFALFPEARQLFRSSTRPLTSSSAFPGRSRTSGSHCSLKESHFSFLMACCLVNFLISSAKFLNLVSALPIFFLRHLLELVSAIVNLWGRFTNFLDLSLLSLTYLDPIRFSNW